MARSLLRHAALIGFAATIAASAAAQNCGGSHIDHRVNYDASGVWNPNVYRGLLGVLTVAQLRQYRGYFWVLAAIGTALVTPPDAGSMIMLLGVVGGLYEVGILAAQLLVKRSKAPDADSETEAAKP